jgi:hypothetical protein
MIFRIQDGRMPPFFFAYTVRPNAPEVVIEIGQHPNMLGLHFGDVHRRYRRVG